MNVLVWLHRDLRVHDHPALLRAAALGRVLPLFVADPEEWLDEGRSARQWAFLAETLAHARGSFAAAGAPLAVRLGPSADVLRRLIAQHRIDRVMSLTDPGPRLRAAAGVEWEVIAPADTPPPTAAQTAAPTSGPAAMQGVAGVEPGAIPPAAALRLAPDRCPNRQAGGDPAPLLAALRPRGAGSVAAMERAASRLSGHLAWGAVSERDLASRPALRRGLALRRAAGATQPPSPCGEALPEAWLRGETGVPFADACLRYMAATGWLPAPLRAMLVSVAVHLLGAAPQAAGRALARLSTDFEAPLLWAGVVEALRRPVDPLALGRRLDGAGSFTRRWLPELSAVPLPFLHAPWRWEGARHLLGHRYPEPLADPVAALRAMRGPRGGGGGGGAPRRAAPAPAGQMTLGF